MHKFYGQYITIDPSVRSAASNDDRPVEHWVNITGIPNGEYEGLRLNELPEGVPRYVLHSQAYYWTKEWQQGEREAQAELDAGNYVEFSGGDPDEIRRWLMSEDE